MTEAARAKRNAEKLNQLFPTFAARLKKVIADLESQGIRPRIQDAHRSLEDQLKAFEAGNAKVKFGFHNVTGSDGTPESLAVDMLDDDHPLAPSVKYLLQLAAAAQKQKLETGILWGLPSALQEGVKTAIAAGDFEAKVKVGWDPTHVQPTGITIQEAKNGKRPL
jgi:hypothetical protein